MDQSLFGFGTLMTCRSRPPLSVFIAGYWYFIKTPAKIGIRYFQIGQPNIHSNWISMLLDSLVRRCTIINNLFFTMGQLPDDWTLIKLLGA